MKKIIVFTLIIVSITALAAWNKEPDKEAGIRDITSVYNNYLDSLELWSTEMTGISKTASADELDAAFRKGRYYYKNIEWIIEQHYPATALRINGAPLLEAEAYENLEPVHPRGFQVLEEAVYSELTAEDREAVVYELSNIRNSILKLKGLKKFLHLSAASVIDGLKLNIYRMMIRGISGFDAPAALSGIDEAVYVLTATKRVFSSLPHSREVIREIDRSIDYIHQEYSGFDAFNRAVFIREYCNPLCTALSDYQVRENIPFPEEPRAINVRAGTLFEPGAFNPLYFAPEGTAHGNEEEVVLGRKLFSDPVISATGNRSCASCHIPDKAFTDALAKNETLVGDRKLLRNTPTLINSALQPSQFYDSRVSFLEDQVHDVITNRDEMDGNLTLIAAKLKKDITYKQLFSRAYPGVTIKGTSIKRALAAYVRSLTAMNSPFDQYMNGNNNAMTVQQVEGFNLFMGKAKCGTCHFMPLFNGAFPPFYYKIESEVLGIPTRNDTLKASLDPDPGKYLLYKIPHQKHAFKTTTVRNAAYTAPYMHNGVFASLEEVIDFYDRGGGAGIGIDLENQTLAPDRLHLSSGEKEALIAFIHALSDTAVTR